ncbi:MAG: type IX secretion system membrane protein PorP/SprF [Bacteroidetes bacterium]|nr:type IX secretion system membrane protein PorP/SprF [Bacteroidota bacterium]
MKTNVNYSLFAIFFLYFLIPPFGGIIGGLFAQQNTLYSQYMFNLFAINPGYAGSRQSTCGVLLYRNQWVGMDGAPQVETFSLHTPFQGKRVALGLNAFNDNIGPSNKMGFFGTYAYHLPLPLGKLSMALRAGIYRYKFYNQKLDYKDKSDPAGNVEDNFLIPGFDFGLYYYNKTLYAGVAVMHISNNQIGFKNDDYLYSGLTRQFIAIAGKAFVVNEKVVLKPSANLKFVDGLPLNGDLNMSCLFRKMYWIGVSYRSSKDVIIIAEVNFTDFLRAGYAYDVGLSGLKKYNNGSHEIFIGFDFGIPREKTVASPRYL